MADSESLLLVTAFNRTPRILYNLYKHNSLRVHFGNECLKQYMETIFPELATT